MAVLKQTSPTAWPVAPKPVPSSTVPSASTSMAVGSGSDQPEVSCSSVMGGLHNRGAGKRKDAYRVAECCCHGPRQSARKIERGQRAPRRHQQCLEGCNEIRRQAPRVDVAPGQFGAEERRYRSARAGQGGAGRRRIALAAAKDDQAAAGIDRTLRKGRPRRACRAGAGGDPNYLRLFAEADVGGRGED